MHHSHFQHFSLTETCFHFNDAEKLREIQLAHQVLTDIFTDDTNFKKKQKKLPPEQATVISRNKVTFITYEFVLIGPVSNLWASYIYDNIFKIRG